MIQHPALLNLGVNDNDPPNGLDPYPILESQEYPILLDQKWKTDFIESLGPRGHNKCACNKSHTELVLTLADTDLRNAALLLENRTWMSQLVDKINLLLQTMDTDPDFSLLIRNIKTENCRLLQATLFFGILDRLRTCIMSASFKMGTCKIDIVHFSFDSFDMSIVPTTKLHMELRNNLSVLVITPTTNFVVPPFQVIKRYFRLHIKY